MKEKEFWKDWKNKTKIEEDAIKVIKFARERILENIPKEEIVSIYVKGSFVRREMNAKSDVDIIVIVKKSVSLLIVDKINNLFGKKCNPDFNISGYSLWEIKFGKKCKDRTGKKINKPHPIKLAPMLPGYKLIYGKPLEENILIKRGVEEDIVGMLESFEYSLFPAYEKGEVDFDFLIKQVFWIARDEQRTLGKNPPHVWRELAKSIKDKNHIVHDALKLRLHPTKDKKEKAKFIIKLKKYLDRLEREYDKS